MITAARLPVNSLRPGFSPRLTGENDEHIRLLADSTDPLPPILVHHPSLRVIDGMHRLRAAIVRGDDVILVEYFDGTEDEAFVHAVRQNITHGLRLTLADRTAAVARILNSYPAWSDNAIASAAGVSNKTVAAIRRRSAEPGPHLNARVGRDGKIRALDAAEGRRRAVEFIAGDPSASLRTIASRSGISLATARDVRERLRRGEDPLPPRMRGNSQPSMAAGTVEATMRILRSDPSVRLTEAGRKLLRLLEVHTMTTDDWERLADQVPTHLLEPVRALSGDGANAWRQFATRLERRQHDKIPG